MSTHRSLSFQRVRAASRSHSTGAIKQSCGQLASTSRWRSRVSGSGRSKESWSSERADDPKCGPVQRQGWHAARASRGDRARYESDHLHRVLTMGDGARPEPSHRQHAVRVHRRVRRRGRVSRVRRRRGAQPDPSRAPRADRRKDRALPVPGRCEGLVARTPERAPHETTYGAALPPSYSEDEAYRDAVERLGLPGEPPYTRGVQPTMYRGRLWTMRQYAGFGTAEETNARFRYLLEHGQTGLSVAFDLPTQMGYDADDPQVAGEVGKVGVSISSLDDLEQLFAGIPLDKVTTSMTINATAAILLAMYAAVAKKQGVSLAGIGGTTQNDILKEYIARGTYIFPPRPSLRLVTDLIAYCATELPRWNPISISGYHIREAGSDSVQELAFTFADAIEYVAGAVKAGLSVDAFAP